MVLICSKLKHGILGHWFSNTSPHQNHGEGMLECKVPSPRVPDPGCLGGPKICISTTIPSDVDSAGPRVTLWDPCSRALCPGLREELIPVVRALTGLSLEQRGWTSPEHHRSPGALLGALRILTNTFPGRYYSLHFTEKDTKVQRRRVTFLRSDSQLVIRSHLELRTVWLRVCSAA